MLLNAAFTMTCQSVDNQADLWMCTRPNHVYSFLLSTGFGLLPSMLNVVGVYLQETISATENRHSSNLRLSCLVWIYLH